MTLVLTSRALDMQSVEPNAAQSTPPQLHSIQQTPARAPKQFDIGTPRHKMTLVRPSTMLRAGRAVASSTVRAQALSTTSKRSAADADHGHEDHYDAPGGWLFGVKPGEKYEKEGWEGLWMYGVFGSLGLAAVAYAFKPDTSYVAPLAFPLPVIPIPLYPGWSEKSVVI